MNRDTAKLQHQAEQLSAHTRDAGAPRSSNDMDMSILANFAMLGAAAVAVEINRDLHCPSADVCRKTFLAMIENTVHQSQLQRPASMRRTSGGTTCSAGWWRASTR